MSKIKTKIMNVLALGPDKALTYRLVAGILILNAIVAIIIYFSLQQSKVQYIDQASVTTQNITQVLDENISGTFATIDVAIQAITDEAQRQLATGAIQETSLSNFIIRQHSRLPDLVVLRATNELGDAIYGPTVTPAKTVSLAHRDYFKHLRDTPSAGLVISKPLIGGISGKWMIILARRINRSDGAFAGLVYSGITLDYLTKSFSKINVGKQGVLALVDSDLSLVARYPVYDPTNKDVGQKINSPQFLKILQSGESFGTYHAKSSIDFIERTYSFRKLSLSNPFYVFSALARSEYLANWYSDVFWLSSFMVLFFLITVVFTWLFYRELCRSREAEYAVFKSDQRFRSFVENVHDIIFTLSAEGVFTYVSPNWKDAFGYELHETIGQPFTSFVHPDDIAGCLTFLQKVLKTGERQSGVEYRVKHENGSFIWYSANGSLLRDAASNEVSFLGIGRDITERKNSEEERDLLERQLYHAQKLESLGVLAGGIAHDFNNLLAVIVGHCELIKLRPAKAMQSISPIEKAANRAAELCQQMLAYAGKSQFAVNQVNMAWLVEETVDMLKSTVGKNIEITSGFSSGLPTIMADASQIKQIVMNVIMNASEAIGENQGKILVSLTKSTIKAEQPKTDHLGKYIPAGCYICLEITDTGCGMDEETKSRLFEPFFTTKFTGRGLGMSAVLGIIAAHKGALQLFSQPGKGSIFRVYLPVQANDSAVNESDQEPAISEQWKGSGTILLVEDEEQVLLVAKTMLEELGFTVIKAYNGKEGLELYQQHAPSITLVVTDIGMPIMDGYALIRELKILNPDLPITISSGFGEVDISSRFSGGEIAGLINKPYNFKQLRDVMRRVVENLPFASHELIPVSDK